MLVTPSQKLHLRMEDTKNDFLSFDGIDDYVETVSLELASGGDYSVSFWVYIDNFETRHRFMGEDGGWIIGNSGGGSNQLAFHHWDWDQTGLGNLPEQEWVYITAVIDRNDNEGRFYIDGELVDTRGNPNTQSSDNPLRFGNYSGGSDSSNSFPGRLNNVRIYNRALSQSEIQDTYKSERLAPTNGLVSYWKLDEGTGSTAYDSEGSNDGTIYGASWVTRALDSSGNWNHGTVVGATLVGGPKVYEEGTEHYNFEEYLQSGSGTSSKESDHLRLYADSDHNGECALGTETTIDFTDINVLYVDWEHISPSGTQDRSYIGIDADRSNINRDNAETGSIEVYKLNSNTNFNRKTEILDVSGLTGEKYIGVGVQCSSTYSESVELKVYNIYVPTGKFGQCYCLLPETPIITDDGVKPIKDLSTEQVIGHNGNFNKVITPLNRDYDDELVCIKPYHFPTVKMTPEHRVYGVKTENCNNRVGIGKGKTRRCRLESCRYRQKYNCEELYKNYKEDWIFSRNITKQDYVIYSFDNSIQDTESIKISDFINQEHTIEDGKIYPLIITERQKPYKAPHAVGIPDEIKIDSKFMLLFGYYLAEGGLNNSNSSIVQFSFNEKEKNYIKEVCGLVKEIFGLDTMVNTSNGCSRITISNKILAELFERLCGRYSYTKKINKLFMVLPLDKQKELLKGYLRGDGCCDGKRVRAVTVSQSLAVDMVNLFLRQKAIPSYEIVKAREYKILGNAGQAREKYEISVQGKLAELFGKENTNSGNPNRGTKGIIKGNKLYLPIHKLYRERYKGKVYNLEVENDNSYNTIGMTVHNSFDGIDDTIIINTGDLGYDYVTLAAWVYANNTAAAYHYIIDGERGQRSFILRVDNNKLHFYTYQDGGYRLVGGPSDFPTGEWVHVAGTYGGSHLRLYVNGNEVNDTAYNGTLDAWDLREIGKDSDSTDRTWNGLIDEVMIFNKALSQSDIKRVMMGLHPLNG